MCIFFTWLVLYVCTLYVFHILMSACLEKLGSACMFRETYSVCLVVSYFILEEYKFTCVYGVYVHVLLLLFIVMMFDFVSN